MASGSEDLRRLREAVAALVTEDVPELLAEARGEARTRVRAVLAEVMAEAMLEQVRRATGASGPVLGSARAAVPLPGLAPAQRTGAVAQSRDRAPVAARDDELGYYVYGVLRAGAAVPSTLPGVEAAHAATTLAAGDLAALVSRVSLNEFNEERLREHLGDIAWVETMARRHEEVLEGAAASATVIPMRLCSIYRDASGVRAMLQRESEPMHDALRLLDGRSEWGVKVFSVASAAAATQADGDGEADGDASPVSGAAYLEQQRQALRRRESAAEETDAIAESIHLRLGGLAARALAIAPQRPEVSGHRGDMVLNGVYLVADAALSQFHEMVGALQQEFDAAGLEFAATGPWPPYNFVPDAIGVSA